MMNEFARPKAFFLLGFLKGLRTASLVSSKVTPAWICRNQTPRKKNKNIYSPKGVLVRPKMAKHHQKTKQNSSAVRKPTWPSQGKGNSLDESLVFEASWSLWMELCRQRHFNAAQPRGCAAVSRCPGIPDEFSIAISSKIQSLQ